MTRLHKLLLDIRPAIKPIWLNKAAGLPANTIGKHYAWADGKQKYGYCSHKHAPDIVSALCAQFGGVICGEYFLEDLGEPMGFAANTPIRRLFFTEAEFSDWMQEDFANPAQATNK